MRELVFYLICIRKQGILEWANYINACEQRYFKRFDGDWRYIGYGFLDETPFPQTVSQYVLSFTRNSRLEILAASDTESDCAIRCIWMLSLHLYRWEWRMYNRSPEKYQYYVSKNLKWHFNISLVSPFFVNHKQRQFMPHLLNCTVVVLHDTLL